MDAFVLGLHNLMRWVVIGVGIWAVLKFWNGWMKRAVWTPGETQAARLFVMVLDIQLLIGLLLYALFSPVTRLGFQDMAAGMRDPAIRYFLVEHGAVMIVAIAVAHIAARRVKRVPTDSAKFQTASIWFGIVLAAVAGFVPWNRPLLPVF